MIKDIRIQSQAAQHLRKDTAFIGFVSEVRESQMMAFADSAADDYEAREEAHAMLRALNRLEGILDAAILAENILNKKEKG